MKVDTVERLGRVREVLAGHEPGAEALLVSSMTNVRYLTGFTGSAGLLFVMPGETVLVTDGRYGTQAAAQLEAASIAARIEVAPAAKQADVAGAVVSSSGIGRLALEAAHVSWARQQSFATEWFEGVTLVSTVGLVEELRKVKDAGELARLGEAARIADSALDGVAHLLASGLSEQAFGRALDFEMRERGASGPSFESIVASGPNAAMPHHRPGSRPIERGETVVLDFGALYDGYCSDMTRTVWAGELEGADLRRAVSVVLAAQAAGVAAVRAGVACVDVDKACRDVISNAGWGERFVHGTGHGVGLDIHEAPWVGATSAGTLQADHVVTVEPGVYLPGLGGVRIEDTVAVTGDGCLPLTRTPKDLP
ncbi:MAG: M24 family metallopeptidase [Acidimicrobiales bacterium]